MEGAGGEAGKQPEPGTLEAVFQNPKQIEPRLIERQLRVLVAPNAPTSITVITANAAQLVFPTLEIAGEVRAERDGCRVEDIGPVALRIGTSQLQHFTYYTAVCHYQYGATSTASLTPVLLVDLSEDDLALSDGELRSELEASFKRWGPLKGISLDRTQQKLLITFSTVEEAAAAWMMNLSWPHLRGRKVSAHVQIQPAPAATAPAAQSASPDPSLVAVTIPAPQQPAPQQPAIHLAAPQQPAAPAPAEPPKAKEEPRRPAAAPWETRGKSWEQGGEQLASMEGRTAFVQAAGMSGPDLDEAAVREAFAKFGRVLRIAIHKKNPRTGVLEFETRDAFNAASKVGEIQAGENRVRIRRDNGSGARTLLGISKPPPAGFDRAPFGPGGFDRERDSRKRRRSPSPDRRPRSRTHSGSRSPSRSPGRRRPRSRSRSRSPTRRRRSSSPPRRSGGGRRSPPAPRTRSPRRDDRSPRRDDRSPRRDHRSPRREERSPKRDQRSPRREERSPRREERSPRREGQAPRKEEQAPRKEEQAPRKEEQAPRKEEQAPRKEEQAPRKEEQAPRKDDRSPVSPPGEPERVPEREREEARPEATEAPPPPPPPPPGPEEVPPSAAPASGRALTPTPNAHSHSPARSPWAPAQEGPPPLEPPRLAELEGKLAREAEARRAAEAEAEGLRKKAQEGEALRREVESLRRDMESLRRENEGLKKKAQEADALRREAEREAEGQRRKAQEAEEERDRSDRQRAEMREVLDRQSMELERLAKGAGGLPWIGRAKYERVKRFYFGERERADELQRRLLAALAAPGEKASGRSEARS